MELKIQHEKANLLGRLQRMDPNDSTEEYRQVNSELMELEHRRRALKQVE